nr:hypothetical protein [Tanacetum cinerariifolium]
MKELRSICRCGCKSCKKSRFLTRRKREPPSREMKYALVSEKQPGLTILNGFMDYKKGLNYLSEIHGLKKRMKCK